VNFLRFRSRQQCFLWIDAQPHNTMCGMNVDVNQSRCHYHSRGVYDITDSRLGYKGQGASTKDLALLKQLLDVFKRNKTK
jgi:hypothetical protein